MDYDARLLPVSEVRAAQEAGYLTREEATFIIRTYFPQLREIDRAKQTLDAVKETE